MDGDERVGAKRQALRCEERGRELLRVVTCVRQHARDQAAQLLLAEILARGIDGREVGGVVGVAEVVGLDGEAVAVLAAAQAHARPRDQLLLEPGLVEPGRADLAACRPRRGR